MRHEGGAQSVAFRKPASWPLRLRVFLFFALIALGAIVVIVGALVYLANALAPERIDPLVLAGVAAVFGIVGVTTWVWLKFDENVARPLVAIAADVRTAVHARISGTPPSVASGRYLGLLAPAVAEFTAALDSARREVDAAVAAATAEAERERRHLEAVLRDLHDGVVICTLDHEVLLYNRRALEILGREGELGLARPLTDSLEPRVLEHALERLLDRFHKGRHVIHRDGLGLLLVGATRRETARVRGRMTLMLDADGAAPVGYVVSFDDVTETLAAGIARDRLLADTVSDIRERVAALSLAGGLVETDAPPAPEDLAVVRRALAVEPQAIGARLDRLEAVASDILAGAWPMAVTQSTTLFSLLEKRPSAEAAPRRFTVDGAPVWLVCDSASIVDLLDRLTQRIAAASEVSRFRLCAQTDDGQARLLVRFPAPPPPPAQLAAWLGETVCEGPGAVTGEDVLARHRTEIWCVADGEGGARLDMPLARAAEDETPIAKAATPLAERPEFYDFGLLRSFVPSRFDDRALRALTFVVFDTETTGLDPGGGDEIVSIAGVRIVNNRVLTGEIFNRLVDPERPIPAVATKVHGITDAMVAGAEPARHVLPRFRRFVGDAVLVAHNAAFDLAALRKRQGEAGVTFDRPVLDTVLLGAHLFGQDASLTLDALATRFGIVIPLEARHTALGDSLATAEVLLKLVPLLEADGVRTLADARAVSDKQARLRRKMAAQVGG